MRAEALVLCLALASYDTLAPAAAGGFGAVQAGSTSTAPPRVTNGRVVPQPAGGNLDATFRRLVAAQAEPGWIGYAVPVVNRSDGRQCCSGDTWISDGIVFTNGRIATCGLEPSTSQTRRPADNPPSWTIGPRG